MLKNILLASIFVHCVSTTYAQTILPTLSPGSTQISAPQVNRFSVNRVDFSTTFVDLDQPGIESFSCTIKIREPNNTTEHVLISAQTTGGGGLTITDHGSGSYTAVYTYDPAPGQALGLYDVYFEVSDGFGAAIDGFANNLDEFEIFELIPNGIPMAQPDAPTATPAGIERIGSNATLISAQFTDLDIPGISVFQVTFKLRSSFDQSEIVLANNAGNGIGGVTMADLGSGLFEASISWDPADGQLLGFYDLFFQVTDGIDSSSDGFENNLDELEVYDVISNRAPGLVSGATSTIPNSVNRVGSEFAMFTTEFWDADYSGVGSFSVTLKVRDINSAETIITNAARQGEQGLRITHLGDSLYRATVSWDPGPSSVIGVYDLFFEVTDDNSSSTVDGYVANSDELAITSSAILGDGYLLHRTNEAGSCGGPTSACHNIKDHQSQDCLVCHEPHSTKNIYLIKDTIQTPNSGPREVVFKTLGIGDPFNDPDPAIGDPNSGVMADDADGVHTGVCEVCHTAVNHHRNDDSHSEQGHNNSANCISCHTHAEGFASGESSGGVACSCHEGLLTSMDSTSLLTRHVLANHDANYSPGASGLFTTKNCLSCHVDHDIFRPDLNVGIGTRSSNLRTDWAIDPVPGNTGVLHNSDYQSTGNGGLCLSCHSGPSCDGCHSAHLSPRQDFSAVAPNVHKFVPKSDYDAATSGHNYSVPVTFGTDGSVFDANCTKCHNDDMGKQYQNSSTQISLHGSTFSRILDTSGVSSPTDPLEERFCFKCHSSTSNPNAGSNLDYFGVKGMGADALNLETAFSQISTHPVDAFSGIHSPIEDPSTMTRHVECEDCHNPHAAAAGGAGLPNSLKDVNGIDVFGNPIAVSTASYQICFKCHSDRPGTTQLVTRQFNNNGNIRQEFDTASVSYHPVVGPGKNPNSPSLIGGWTETSVMTCEDCHASSNGTVNGPHGSAFSPVLKLRYDTGDNLAESQVRYALCYSCHSRTSILGDESFGEHDKHIVGEDTPCSVCHDAHGSTGQSHLVNFDTDICTPAAGRLEFIDDGTFQGQCYVTCHGKDHTPKSY